jgi:hypothetical protein
VTSGASHIQVRGPKARLELRHASLFDMSLTAANGATLVLTDSIIRGDVPFTIDVPAGCTWKADGNAYGAGIFQIGGTTFPTKEFVPYQNVTGQDVSSKVPTEWKESEGGRAAKASLVGADTSRIP